MQDYTITTESAVGQRLEMLNDDAESVSYLMFNKNKINLVAKISIGRASDNDVVIDNKLASRHHAIIQKIKEDFFIKDTESTNGTYLNGKRIPNDKYVKLHKGDKITIGNDSFIMA